MPNWCSTSINIYHPDKEKIDNLISLINEWTSKNYMDNGFGTKWLGNIVLGSGVGTVDEGKETDLKCSGWLDYVDTYKDSIDIGTETAWAPMVKMWLKIAEKYIPGAIVYYMADEPGCELYYSNDPEIAGKYYVDFCDYDSEIYNESGTVEILQEILNTDESDILKLLKMLDESELSDKVFVHQYKEVPIEELD